MPGWAQPWALAGAVLAGLTVFLLLAPPPRRPPRRHPAKVTASRLRRLLAGRVDALALRTRVVLGAGGALAVGVLLQRLVLPGAGPRLLVLLVPLAVVTTLALGWLEPGAARRRRQRLVLQTPQALELLAACLVAGLPVRTALAAVLDAFDGPVAEDLGLVQASTALGIGDADAWKTLSAHPQLGPAAADLARSVESGTLLVEGLRHHAARARDQRQAALQVVARGVGVRSVLPLMCCFIPSFMLLGVVPSVASALAHAFQI